MPYPLKYGESCPGQGVVLPSHRAEKSKRVGSGQIIPRGPIAFAGAAPVLFAAGWFILVLGGTALLWDYGSSPGQTAKQPQRWPESCPLSRNPRGYTLLLFAHPRCPCTRATMREFDILLSRLGSRAQATVLFLHSKHVDADWHRTDLWQHASRIVNTNVVTDRDGVEAVRFGALHSGHVMLFDRKGELCFSGGITASRGHEGDNVGRTSIESLVLRGTPRETETAVYGCSLR